MAHRVLLLTAVFALWAAPTAEAQIVPRLSYSSASSDMFPMPVPQERVRLYLHAREPCGSEFYLDTQDSAGDVETCGSVAPALIETPVETYVGRAPLNYSVQEFFPATFRLYVRADRADFMRLEPRLIVGGGQCTAPMSWDYERRPVTEAWDLFELDCTFSGGGVAGQKPRLEIDVRRDLSHFIGHEGDHASYVEFGADPVGSAEPATRALRAMDAPSSKASSPGIAAMGLLGAVAVAVTVVRQRE